MEEEQGFRRVVLSSPAVHPLNVAIEMLGWSTRPEGSTPDEFRARGGFESSPPLPQGTAQLLSEYRRREINKYRAAAVGVRKREDTVGLRKGIATEDPAANCRAPGHETVQSRWDCKHLNDQRGRYDAERRGTSQMNPTVGSFVPSTLVLTVKNRTSGASSRPRRLDRTLHCSLVPCGVTTRSVAHDPSNQKETCCPRVPPPAPALSWTHTRVGRGRTTHVWRGEGEDNTLRGAM
ncbi:hypothetical protein SKAU_G00047930 [Synaphobranchus kaupii]|uniref:Uncharacterized protein n=1 Tax=Synaphobranchus kaupii TaxID=118154 RepID=A0A9Q1G2E1_SYNKA|nr:hypothetical protein SKAU_G00047930 [Synaphobranchus kaupii]